jgi:hypothetical protein
MRRVDRRFNVERSSRCRPAIPQSQVANIQMRRSPSSLIRIPYESAVLAHPLPILPLSPDVGDIFTYPY